MRVTLESTTKVVTLVTEAGSVPARLWEGTTESGIPCHAFITRIAARSDSDLSEFQRELQQQVDPSRALAGVYDARLVL